MDADLPKHLEKTMTPVHDGDLRARKRLLAVLVGASLGVALAAGAVGALAYWRESYVHGTEVCIRCGVGGDVDRRGPIEWRSEPRGSAPDFLRECAAHTWEPDGCWEIDGAFVRFLTPIVLASAVEDVIRKEYEVPIIDLRLLVERTPLEARALRTEARGWLAYALNGSGDPEGALAELAPALEEDPLDPWLPYEQGRAWTAMGEHERAIEAYRRSAELDPGYARAWQGLGYCLLIEKRPQEALEADTRALGLAEVADEGRLRYWRTDRTTLLREILDERALCYDALGDAGSAARDRARVEELRASE